MEVATMDAWGSMTGSDVQLAATGNREAFLRLVTEHRNLVASIALASVGDVAGSEDVAQDVFLDAWRGLPRLRNPDHFLPWLRTLARNHANQALRSRYRGERLAGQVMAVSTADDPRGDAQRAIVQREDERVLARAIEQLPEDAREVVVLFYREGRSVAQTAELLELKEDAVKKRLSRAREALRESVMEQLGEGLARTSPSQAFCAGVMAALPTALPGAATGLASSVLKGALPMKLASALGGAFAGFAMGAAGIVVGTRKELAQTRSPEERRAVLRVGIAAMAFMVIGMAGIALGLWWHQMVLSLGIGLFFWAGMTGVYGLWLPRIQARRFAAMLNVDPVNAPRLIRRKRVRYWIGMSLGLGLSLAGILAGFLAALQGR